jgi:hypothetical protein
LSPVAVPASQLTTWAQINYVEPPPSQSAQQGGVGGPVKGKKKNADRKENPLQGKTKFYPLTLDSEESVLLKTGYFIKTVEVRVNRGTAPVVNVDRLKGAISIVANEDFSGVLVVTRP